MPRPKNNILHDLLDKNVANEIVCNNGNCKWKVLNPHSGNLERHLRQLHPDLYCNYLEQKNAKQTKPTPLKAKIQANDLNRTNIELAIVELFTKNGRPLHMVEDRAFKILVQPAFDALGIRVNKHNINQRIIAFSQKLKTEIIEDLKGKLLSLKIDAATRQDLSVLGINVHYIKNKGIQIKTLAVKELKSTHTSEHLKSVILEVLKEYAIDIKQILTITTANGSHLLKAVNDSNEDLQLVEEDVDNTVDGTDVHCGLNDDQMESILFNFSSHSTTGVRCGAHTLQLCVYDVIRNSEIEIKLENCRSVVKMLSTQTYLNRNKIPIIDCVTRWNSTFNMLQQLLEIKYIIDLLGTENPRLYLSPDEWNFVHEFIETFKPIYMATIKLQTEQLCFSELHVIIMDILYQVEGLSAGEMKTLLINALNKREAKLFDIELYNAAVFLDPRIKICLNNEQKERAKIYITWLYKRMETLKEIAAEAIESTSLYENAEGSPTSNRSLATSFSEFVQNPNPGSPELNSSLLSHLEEDIVIYERQLRIPLDSNIVDYWSVQNNYLSVIANVILAVPCTQVSVERLFSALKYILSDQRNRSTALNMEHVLMVQANGIFNYED